MKETSKPPSHLLDSLSVRLLNPIDAHPSLAIWAMFVLGLLIATIMLLNNPPSLKSGETDSWWVIAQNVAHGHGYSLCMPQYFPFCGASNQITATREPAPVLLFAFVAWLSKDSLFVAELVEVLIYLTLIYVIYRLTLEWASPRVAVIAAFLWALYLPALELLPQVSGDLFAALCTALGILFALRAGKTRRPRHWVLTGLSLGLAVVSRAATLVILVMVVGGQILDRLDERGKRKELFHTTLLVCLSALVIVVPWSLRNQIALGKPIVGSSLTGYNLYRHNYMLQDSNFFRYVGSEEAAKATQALLARRADLRGDENEAEMDIVYRGEALSIISAHPIRYALLSAYRFFPLWFDWKIAQAYGRVPNRYDYFIMLLQALLLILAVLGLGKDVRRTWPLWGSILLLSLAYMAVDARLLYVMPIMPLVLSLSANGLNKLLQKLQGRDVDSSVA